MLPTEEIEDVLKELDKYDTKNVYLITWLHAYEALERYMKKLREQERREKEKAMKQMQKMDK